MQPRFGKRLPQLRDVDLHHLLSRVRNVLGPESVDDLLAGDGAVRVQEQDREERPLLACGHLQPAHDHGAPPAGRGAENPFETRLTLPPSRRPAVRRERPTSPRRTRPCQADRDAGRPALRQDAVRCRPRLPPSPCSAMSLARERAAVREIRGRLAQAMSFDRVRLLDGFRQRSRGRSLGASPATGGRGRLRIGWRRRYPRSERGNAARRGWCTSSGGRCSARVDRSGPVARGCRDGRGNCAEGTPLDRPNGDMGGRDPG